MGIRDTRMIARALRERWLFEDQDRDLMMQVLKQIAADANNSPRERTQAIRTIISADALNLKAEEIQQKNEHHHDRIDLASLHRIAEVAKSIGLNDIAQRAIEAGSNSNLIRDDAANHNQDNRT
jgi:hypothetical protein